VDDWRQIFKQKAYQVFGHYPEIYLCENEAFGDYYSNIALLCKDHAAVHDFKQELACLAEWVSIGASASGLINFKLTTKAKLLVLQRWQTAHLQMSAYIPRQSTWQEWRLLHIRRSLANFGVVSDLKTCGQCHVFQNNQLLEDINDEALSHLWLWISSYKTHQDVRIEWIQARHSVIVAYERLGALFQQWDVQPIQIQGEDILNGLHERRLLSSIGQFDDMKKNTVQFQEMALWNKYLKSIAREIQSYYNVVVLNDNNLRERFSRFLMLKAVHNVLNDGLAYLGWSPVRE
jgi:DALR anticodon binding domain